MALSLTLNSDPSDPSGRLAVEQAKAMKSSRSTKTSTAIVRMDHLFLSVMKATLSYAGRSSCRTVLHLLRAI